MQFIQALTTAEQESYKKVKGLSATIGDKLQAPKNEKKILYLQYYKLIRNADESIEEWMGRIRAKAMQCKYRDQRLNEQFINDINDKSMTADIIRELTDIKDMSEVTNEQVLSCAKRVERQ